MFLAAAAGSTSSEFKINKPTQEILRVTMIAIITVNNICVRLTEIPLVEANCGQTIPSVSLFEDTTQKMQTTTRIIARNRISKGVTDRISPIRYLLNFVKLPPSNVARKMPRATAVLDKTPIIVSDACLLLVRK